MWIRWLCKKETLWFPFFVRCIPSEGETIAAKRTTSFPLWGIEDYFFLGIHTVISPLPRLAQA